jgi:hypothetical protein
MGVSERFACRVTGQHRTTQRHQPASSTPADPDAALLIGTARDIGRRLLDGVEPNLVDRRTVADSTSRTWEAG